MTFNIRMQQGGWPQQSTVSFVTNHGRSFKSFTNGPIFSEHMICFNLTDLSMILSSFPLEMIPESSEPIYGPIFYKNTEPYIFCVLTI